MVDRLTLLGTKGGPAIRQDGAMPTSSLLNLAGATVVVDCGIGTTRSIVQAGGSLLDIDAVFVTHLHSDHVLDLGPLLYTAWTTGLGRRVEVFGPPGIESYWQGFMASMRFDHDIRVADEGRAPLDGLIGVTTYGAGCVARLGAVLVRACRVSHPPIDDTFALRFDADGKSVVFSADTCFHPPLADFAAGADILVHEAMHMRGLERLIARTPGAGRLREHLLASHTPAADVGRIASRAMVRHLVLNHLIPADDPEITEADWRDEIATTWNGKVSVGRDGLTIPIRDHDGGAG